MKKMKYFVTLLLATSITFWMISCGGNSSGDSSKVTILYPNWAEGIAFTYLAKVALENHDYAVDLINLEPGLIYGELSKSNSKGDVFLDAWLLVGSGHRIPAAFR